MKLSIKFRCLVKSYLSSDTELMGERMEKIQKKRPKKNQLATQWNSTKEIIEENED